MMMAVVARVLAGLAVSAVAFAAEPAIAERRVALVLGNSAYKHTGPLVNPRNDAEDIAAALRGLGFEVVEGVDLEKAGMDRKVREFATLLSGASVGVFFYAGHALQVGGENYLAPIDAELSNAAALDWEMVRLDLIQRTMERSDAKTNILFLDACRDNPLSRNLARAMGTRSAEIGQGLAATQSGAGTLISFSTQPGYVAFDGTGRNSPFAGPLAKHLLTPGADLSRILYAVRNDVMEATNNQQVPWDHSALRRAFYFQEPPAKAGSPSAHGSDTAAAPPQPAAALPSEPRGPMSEAARAWLDVQSSLDADVLDAYARQFPDTVYAALARQRRDQLAPKGTKTAAATPPSQPEPETKPSPPVAPVAAEVPRRPQPLSPETERTLKPRDSFRECDDCPEMAVVATGQYTMGSPGDEAGREAGESPQRKVTIGTTFAVSMFEVTFAEWDACVASAGCGQKPGTDWGRGRHPVIRVSWEDVTREYLPWLSRKTGKSYRLLTEAEWEYVARSWSTTAFSTGPSISSDQANFDGTVAYGPGGKGVHRNATVETGSFQPNAFGLFDIHGNVWEWVQDCYEEGYGGAPSDGSAREEANCEARVLRGGSWSNAPRFLRSANRGKSPPGARNYTIGFRVAQTLAR